MTTESSLPPVHVNPVGQGAEDEDEISLLDLLQVVVENLRLLVLGPLCVGLLALGYTFTIAPTYTASTKFMPPQQQQSSAVSMLAGLGALGGLAGAAAGLKNPADQYVAFLKSRSVQDALVDRFKLMERYESKFREDASKELSSNILIAAGKDGLITIDASDKDPAFAAELANAHVEELGNLLKRLAVTEAQQRRMFFEKQLAIAKEGLTKADKIIKSKGINMAILKTSPQTALTGLATLKAQITAQEIKLSSMRGYLAESAPDFKQALTELSALRGQLAKLENDEPSTGKVNATAGGDYISAYRDYKYYETLFELFAKQFEMAKLDEAREGAVIQVLDPAQPPERKSKPKKAMIAMIATLASGFGLLLFVFIRQALRGANQTPETAQKLQNLRGAWGRALGRG